MKKLAMVCLLGLIFCLCQIHHVHAQEPISAPPRPVLKRIPISDLPEKISVSRVPGQDNCADGGMIAPQGQFAVGYATRVNGLDWWRPKAERLCDLQYSFYVTGTAQIAAIYIPIDINATCTFSDQFRRIDCTGVFDHNVVWAFDADVLVTGGFELGVHSISVSASLRFDVIFSVDEPGEGGIVFLPAVYATNSTAASSEVSPAEVVENCASGQTQDLGDNFDLGLGGTIDAVYNWIVTTEQTCPMFFTVDIDGAAYMVGLPSMSNVPSSVGCTIDNPFYIRHLTCSGMVGPTNGPLSISIFVIGEWAGWTRIHVHESRAGIDWSREGQIHLGMFLTIIQTGSAVGAATDEK